MGVWRNLGCVISVVALNFPLASAGAQSCSSCLNQGAVAVESPKIKQELSRQYPETPYTNNSFSGAGPLICPPGGAIPNAPIAVEDTYAQGRRLYVQGRFEEAAAVFDTLAARASNHPLAANALYWRGECSYDQARYQEAICFFTRVVREYPDSPKAPDALLKIVFSYGRLDEGPVAMANMGQLLKRYPKSQAARRVKSGQALFKKP